MFHLFSLSAHNRFHYNCCDKKSPSLDEIKAQSLMNVAKRRKSRMNTSGSSNGGGTSGSSQASITTAVPTIQSPGLYCSLLYQVQISADDYGPVFDLHFIILEIKALGLSF